MEQEIQSLFADLEGEDKDKQYSAFVSIMEKLNMEVDWAYEVWDMLLAWLKDKDNIVGQGCAIFGRFGNQ